MEDSSRESNGADVASREDLSLFDEEILFGPNPNDTYSRHLVGDEDNNMIIDDEEADASLQDWVETPMTVCEKRLCLTQYRSFLNKMTLSREWYRKHHQFCQYPFQ
jgi:hypothetical protein